jgi:hypothetical protein
MSSMSITQNCCVVFGFLCCSNMKNSVEINAWQLNATRGLLYYTSFECSMINELWITFSLTFFKILERHVCSSRTMGGIGPAHLRTCCIREPTSQDAKPRVQPGVKPTFYIATSGLASWDVGPVWCMEPEPYTTQCGSMQLQLLT